MNVYVLTRNDEHDRTEVLGVFASEETAKQAAEAREPARTFSWSRFGDEVFVTASPFTGPNYNYDVVTFKVTR